MADVDVSIATFAPDRALLQRLLASLAEGVLRISVTGTKAARTKLYVRVFRDARAPIPLAIVPFTRTRFNGANATAVVPFTDP